MIIRWGIDKMCNERLKKSYEIIARLLKNMDSLMVIEVKDINEWVNAENEAQEFLDGREKQD